MVLPVSLRSFDFVLFGSRSASVMTDAGSIVMVPKSPDQNLLRETLKLRSKERQWNERFHVGRIPTYDYYNDPYSLSRKPPTPANDRILKSRASSSSLIRARATQPRIKTESYRAEQEHEYRRFDQSRNLSIKRSLRNLDALWQEKDIPHEHRLIFCEIINHSSNHAAVLKELHREEALIRQNSEPIQRLLATVAIRQKCLSGIVAALQGNFSPKDFSTKLQQLRILNILCVENIQEWRLHLEALAKHPIFASFRIGGVSFGRKLAEDIEWLRNNTNPFLSWPLTMDPFFVRVEPKIDGLNLETSRNLLKRISACRFILQSLENIDRAYEMQTDRHHRMGGQLPPTSSIQQPTQITKLTMDLARFPEYFAELASSSPYARIVASDSDPQKYGEFTIFCYGSGRFVVAVDRSAATRKICILAMNCPIPQSKEHLKTLFAHLWSTDSCGEIRISLTHLEQSEGKLQVDQAFEEELKEIGFRWVCVSNNSETNRTTTYGMKKPQSLPVVPAQQFPFVVEQHTAFYTPPNEQQVSHRHGNCCPLSIMSLLKLTRDQGQPHAKQIIQHPAWQAWLPILKTLTRQHFDLVRSFRINSPEDADNIDHSSWLMKPQLIIPNMLTVLSLAYRLRSRTILEGGYLKLLPGPNPEIIMYDSQWPIYLIPTQDESINIFVFEVEPTFTEALVPSIFNAKGKQSKLNEQLWLPIFSKRDHYFDELGLPNTLLVSNNFQSRLGSLTCSRLSTTKVIRAPFALGLTSRELLQKVQLPLFMTVIRQQDLVRPGS